MAEIPLSDGQVALVDDADAAWISRWSWRCVEGYAMRTHCVGDVRFTAYMHRAILMAPRTYEVDHINGDKLDNRRQNLRLVTHAQNAQNLQRARADSSTGVRGVFAHPNGRFRAYVYVDKRRVHLGYFATADEADAAARAARAELMTHSAESDGRAS